MRVTRIYLALLTIFWLPLSLAEAQTQPIDPIVTGVVKTPSGALLSHARVFLSDTKNPAATTDADGKFQLRLFGGNVTERKEGADGPAALVMPFDESAGEVAFESRGFSADFYRERLMENLARRVPTRWREHDGIFDLEVLAPEIGAIKVRLRGPDGQLLRQTDVQFFISGPNNFYGQSAAILETKTDAEGFADLRFFAGAMSFRVAVPGIGFGASALFEVETSKTKVVEVPPLARFADIEGRVALDLRGPIATIATSETSLFWPQRRASIGEDGRFVLRDVFPGLVGLKIENATVVFSGARRLWLAPGEVRRDVEIHAQPITARSEELPRKIENTKTIAGGFVRDENGAPVAGADVYALCTYHGGMRMVQQAFKVTTAADGGFQFDKLPSRMSFGNVSFFAYRKGNPLAIAVANVPQSDRFDFDAIDDATDIEVKTDLVLPSRGGALEIRVVDGDRNPAKDVDVKIQTPNEVGMFYGPNIGSMPAEAYTELTKLLYSSQKTDEKGVARFENLAPGNYRVACEAMNQKSDGANYNFFDPSVASSVAVEVGVTRTHSMKLLAAPAAATMRILDPDGAPVAGRYIDVTFWSAGGENYSRATSSDSDENGMVRFSNSSGLWNYRARFKPLGENINVSDFSFSSESVLAISALVPRAVPVQVKVRKVLPGSLIVVLKNEKGQTVEGTVILENYEGVPGAAITTGAAGKADFGFLPTGRYYARGYAEGVLPPPDIGAIGDAMPDEKQLQNQFASPRIEVQIEAEKIARLELQPQKIGYVKGRVAPGAGVELKEVSLHIPYHTGLFDNPIRFDANSGEFLVGPLGAGKVKLNLYRKTENGKSISSYLAESKEFEIAPGQVVSATLSPRAATREISAQLFPVSVYPRPAKSITGRVLLPNGQPAWNARVRVYEPGAWKATGGAVTDAAGVFKIKGGYFDQTEPAIKPPGSPQQPVIVAWIPGNHGAVILPLSNDKDAKQEEVELKLPAPEEVLGRVTVGRKSPANLPATIRVLASREGDGKLNEILSADVTAQSDGSFALRGLTPGRYRVQASLDNIWLSASQVVEIKANATVKNLYFNIAAPAAPQILEWSENGKPAGLLEVEVLRPIGPLTEQLWPKTFRTDARGVLRLEGLEVGRHTLVVHRAGSEREWKFEIDAPAPDEKFSPVTTQFKLR